MLAEIIFTRPTQQLKTRSFEIFKKLSDVLNDALFYSKKNALADACLQIAEVTLRKAVYFTKKVPVPGVLTKHLCKKDLTFIAAAYAIPLPGTALFAAALVGSKLGFGHLRRRLKHRLSIDTSNG